MNFLIFKMDSVLSVINFILAVQVAQSIQKMKFSVWNANKDFRKEFLNVLNVPANSSF